jgi:hypothetical protein
MVSQRRVTSWRMTEDAVKEFAQAAMLPRALQLAMGHHRRGINHG